MIVDPNILIVIATIVSVFGFSSALAGWVNGIWPIPAMLSLAIGIGLFVFVHLQLPQGLGFWDIPNAFIHVAAKILN